MFLFLFIFYFVLFYFIFIFSFIYFLFFLEMNVNQKINIMITILFTTYFWCSAGKLILKFSLFFLISFILVEFILKKFRLGIIMIMVKNCATFQKLHFLHFFIQSVIFGGPTGSKFQNLKSYPLATPVVVCVLFLSDTLWVTEHSDHAVENVSHIL